jgi:hypothetical protein
MSSDIKFPLFKYFGHPQGRPSENGALKVLDQLALKVTPPIQFDDPFEFAPIVTEPNPDQRSERDFSCVIESQECFEMYRKQFPDCEVIEDYKKRVDAARDEIIPFLKASAQRGNQEFEQNALPLLSEHFGIVCFSADPVQPLMWAHYAAAHAGLMIEFSDGCSLFRDLEFIEVDYFPKRAPYDPSKPHDLEQLKTIARRKSTAWAYQKEFRLIVELARTKNVQSSEGHIFHLLPIDPVWIRSVTLGLRTNGQLKVEADRLLSRAMLCHVEKYQIIMKPSEFGLERVKMKQFC